MNDDKTAKFIVDDHAQLKNRRANFDNYWQDICDLVAPEYGVFTRRTTQGEEKHNRIYDNTTHKCLYYYSSVSNTMLTPRNRQWHYLRAKNEYLKKNIYVSSWLEKKTKYMFSMRYSPNANFASQVDMIYIMDGLIGNGCLYVDGNRQEGLRYRNIHPNEIYIKPNHQGMVDHIHREYMLKGYQALQLFGDELPSEMRTEKSMNKDFTFIHCVKPNTENYDRNSLRPDRHKFISYDVCLDCPKILRTSGYRTMPYIYNRHMVAPDEDYGRSPAMRIMPLIKMINEKQRTNIRAAQLAVSPPILLGDTAHLQPFSARPAFLNYNYLMQDGREMAKPFNLGVRPDIGLDVIERDAKNIEDEFFVNLYNILTQTPNMTATEVMQRTQEKAQLLAPAMGRKQSEFLGPLIEREIDVLSFNFGFLDDLPDELAQGDSIEFEYESEMTRSMQADEGVGIMRTLETALQVAQADQSVLDIFNFPEVMRELTRINGVPSKLLRSTEEIEAIQEQRNEQQQISQTADVAQKMAPVANVAQQMGMI